MIEMKLADLVAVVVPEGVQGSSTPDVMSGIGDNVTQ